MQAEEMTKQAESLGLKASALEEMLNREEAANARQNRLKSDLAKAHSKLEVWPVLLECARTVQEQFMLEPRSLFVYSSVANCI